MRSGTWKARLTMPDGSRRWFNLGTTDKTAARRKLAKLIKDQAAGVLPEPEEVKAVELTDNYAAAWLDGRARRKLPSAPNERRTYEHVWKPAIGRLPMDKVHGGLIQSTINEAVDGRIVGLRGEPYSRQSILHMRATILRMFEAAWRGHRQREPGQANAGAGHGRRALAARGADRWRNRRARRAPARRPRNQAVGAARPVHRRLANG
ncbi:MAG TPA: hypothetical protein VMI54_04160 [Polyangiaceae bacterium]|nr:hypothetical protein [Polyangiaceae bacterium]